MLKKIAFVLLLSVTANTGFAQSNLVLWYSKPAGNWNEALPIGNGRLGAMIFGRPDNELIQLNEQTLWTSGPVNPNPNPDAIKYLQPVRDLLFKDSIAQASKLMRHMQGPNTAAYQPLGDLIIRQPLAGTTEGYRRDLNIANAIATTRFTTGGITYKRELFTSAPDQVMVVHLSASKKGALNFAVSNNHPLQFERTINANNELVLRGKARVQSDESRNRKPVIFNDEQSCNGMRFEWRVKVLSNDGKLSTDSILHISGATDVVLLVTGATSYNGFDKCPDKEGKNESALVQQYLHAASQKTLSQLRNAHIRDYTRLFNRVALNFDNTTAPDLPIDERLAAYKKGGNDLALESLYFQFGRYLLISSSRPGGIPANLQGVWNPLVTPPWRSNYTTNINLQMNYWPAEMCNLSELTEPLMSFIQRLSVNGRATAQNYYNMRGWAVHHNSDIWAATNPVGESTGDPKWASWAMGSPWLCQHLYEHYRFTTDKKFLKNVAYPLMKGAADFCLDWLVEKDGKLITAPSTSPENTYILPNGTKGEVTIASAMDMEIIWDLFTNLIEASRVLGIDQSYAAMLAQKRSMLLPLQVGKQGNLVEWYNDWQDEDPHHRHVSHLFGLHPGREISPLLDTTLANAARKTLLIRGDEGTGWSKAWKINFWARLMDGDHAYKVYQELLKVSTLNNLFDTHPPFQIDGNFGAASGIAEMLLQSHLQDIQLLPALPAKWANGHVKGLIARGAFEVEMIWKNGKLQKASILSKAGQLCRLRTNQKLIVAGLKASSHAAMFNQQVQYQTSFPTQAGKRYDITALNE